MSSPRPEARVIGLARPLKDVTVIAGETATFECELSYEGIAVEWSLGGTKLEPSDRVSPKTPDTLPETQGPEFRSGARSGPESGPPGFAATVCSYKVLQVEVQDSS